MDQLIEALQILRKYDNPDSPTHCEHDVLYVGVSPDLVSELDIQRLDELGFIPGSGDYEDCFLSYRFGSA
jgi:hypothetical protein